jgi:hypothetical protein
MDQRRLANHIAKIVVRSEVAKMVALESFSPQHLIRDAKESGFFQCPKCGLIWFGREDVQECPQGSHGRPVRVVILCRVCDATVSLHRFVHHLSSESHASCSRTF